MEVTAPLKPGNTFLGTSLRGDANASKHEEADTTNGKNIQPSPHKQPSEHQRHQAPAKSFMGTPCAAAGPQQTPSSNLRGTGVQGTEPTSAPPCMGYPRWTNLQTRHHSLQCQWTAHSHAHSTRKWDPVSQWPPPPCGLPALLRGARKGTPVLGWLLWSLATHGHLADKVHQRQTKLTDTLSLLVSHVL